VDTLGTTERGNEGFGSSNLNPKRSITAKEEGIKICFLQAENGNTEFFSVTDIGYHSRLMREREMLSSTHINAAMTRTMNDPFLNKIKVRGKKAKQWQE